MSPQISRNAFRCAASISLIVAVALWSACGGTSKNTNSSSTPASNSPSPSSGSQPGGSTGSGNGNSSGSGTSGSTGSTSGSGSNNAGNSGATYLYAAGFTAAGNAVHGYKVDANNADITELPGSPFSEPATNIAASRTFVYTSTVNFPPNPATIVTAFRVDGATGDLTQIGTSTIPASGNPGAAALVTESTGHNLYAVTGTPGDIVSFAINSDGTLSSTGAPAHLSQGVFSLAISPNGLLAYAAVASGDFKAGTVNGGLVALNRDPNSGALSVNQQVSSILYLSDLQFDPSGKYLLALAPSEKIYVFSVDYATGNLTQVAGSPFTSAGMNPAPDFTRTFRFDPSGKFIYALNDNAADPKPENLSVLAFNQATGALTSVQTFDLTPGTNPVSLVVDQTLAIAVNSDSGAHPSNIDVVKRDANTGALSAGGNPALVQGGLNLNGAVEVHF